MQFFLDYRKQNKAIKATVFVSSRTQTFRILLSDFQYNICKCFSDTHLFINFFSVSVTISNTRSSIFFHALLCHNGSGKHSVNYCIPFRYCSWQVLLLTASVVDLFSGIASLVHFMNYMKQYNSNMVLSELISDFAEWISHLSWLKDLGHRKVISNY